MLTINPPTIPSTIYYDTNAGSLSIIVLAEEY
jgi:hypothetical protein